MNHDNNLIWEAWSPKFNSRERDRLSGVDKQMPVNDVKIDSPFAHMSDQELQDQLEGIQLEIEKRSRARSSRRDAPNL